MVYSAERSMEEGMISENRLIPIIFTVFMVSIGLLIGLYFGGLAWLIAGMVIWFGIASLRLGLKATESELEKLVDPRINISADSTHKIFNNIRSRPPKISILKKLIIDRCINDPANSVRGGSSVEEIDSIVESLSEDDILRGSPEGLIFLIVERYAEYDGRDILSDMKIMMVDRLFMSHAAKKLSDEIGRELSELEYEQLFEREVANYPEPLTLERYIDYRVAYMDGDGISKAFVDKARNEALAYFSVEDDDDDED